MGDTAFHRIPTIGIWRFTTHRQYFHRYKLQAPPILKTAVWGCQVVILWQWRCGNIRAEKSALIPLKFQGKPWSQQNIRVLVSRLKYELEGLSNFGHTRHNPDLGYTLLHCFGALDLFRCFTDSGITEKSAVLFRCEKFRHQINPRIFMC